MRQFQEKKSSLRVKITYKLLFWRHTGESRTEESAKERKKREGED